MRRPTRGGATPPESCRHLNPLRCPLKTRRLCGSIRQWEYSMIKDAAVKDDIDQQWRTIAYMLNYNKSGIIGGSAIATEQAPDDFYVPLVLTYCTLECALAQLMEEGTIPFQKKKLHHNIPLGTRMEAAKL